MSLINILIYSFLGLIQGLTEPIPVSSSGHLVIFQSLFKKIGVDIPTHDIAFDVIVNTGSLIAIMYYYRKDIIRILSDFFGYIASKTKDNSKLPGFRFGLMVIIATIPAALGGFFFNKFIESTFNNVKLVGCTLLITASLLMYIHRFGYKGKKTTKNINIFDAIKVGIAQLFALIPGISRSGATITAGMASGLEQKSARDFSFFMFMPVSVGAIILELKDFFGSANFATLWLPYLIAFFVSIFATYFALLLLFKIMKERKLNYFATYCLIVGVITILFL